MSNASAKEPGFTSQLPSEAERLSWTKGLCETIRDCHRIGVLHRDINPWNVLIGAQKAEDGSRKLCLADFGLTVRMDGQAVLSGLESEGAVDLDDSALESLYSAPELGKRYGLPADIFSVGMLLLAIWSTLDVKSEQALIDCVEAVKLAAMHGSEPADNVLESLQGGHGSELRTLIISMVSAQPHVRPSAETACKEVEQWLAKRAREATPATVADEKSKGGILAKLCGCLSPKPATRAGD
jgi:serine/threonine protein kinase